MTLANEHSYFPLPLSSAFQPLPFALFCHPLARHRTNSTRPFLVLVSRRPLEFAFALTSHPSNVLQFLPDQWQTFISKFYFIFKASPFSTECRVRPK